MLNRIKKFSKTFLLMVCCIFTLTIGQFLPVYFINKNIAFYYYALVFFILLLSTAILIFKKLYLKENRNIHYSWVTACITSIGVVLIFIIIKFIGSLAVWQDATILYTNKNASQIKIVTRYINEGAFGGGTEPNDYEVVLRRPLFSVLKIETKIDTTKIDKSEWVKKVYDMYDTKFDEIDK